MKIKTNAVIYFSVVLLSISCKKTPTDHNSNSTKKHSADLAVSWYNYLTNSSRITPYLPAPTVRILAYAGIALYESVVPGMPAHKSMYTHFTGQAMPFDGQKKYYWPAAANAAVARITSRLMANYSATPNLVPVQRLEDSLMQIYASIISPEQLQLSIDWGRTIADKIYEWSTTDGTLNSGGTLAACPPYTPLGGGGNWVPTPPGFFPAAGACQGNLRTFIPGIVQATRPPAPPPYSTDVNSDFYKMADRIYQISLTRTTSDSLISEAWRDRVGMNFNTPAHVVRITTHIIAKEKLNLEEAALLYAQQGVAMFDAIAANFDAKFRYSILRPITYIRNTMAKSNWNSIYPTPQHPAYPSVAPCAAAACIVLLEKRFGTSYSFADSTQQNLYGTRNYSSLNQLLLDVGMSRTHSGLNFEIAVTEGMKQGRMVGENVYNLPLKK